VGATIVRDRIPHLSSALRHALWDTPFASQRPHVAEKEETAARRWDQPIAAFQKRLRRGWCDTAATSHLREPDSGSMENVHGRPRNEDTMPQPFKGDRRNITVRMQAADAQKLQKFSDITGDSKSDVVARLVMDFLKTIDFDSISGQEALPIAKAS
jgi:hypothetical protein